MAACQKVLGMCELLEQIIANLPPLEIRRFKTVNKTWLQLIKTSKEIKRAQCLKPENEPAVPACMPLYPAGTPTLKLNPACPWGRHPNDEFEIKGLEQFRVLMLDSAFSFNDIPMEPTGMDARDQYITSPPVQALQLYRPGRSNNELVVNSDGVRVKHLCDAMGWPQRHGELRGVVGYYIRKG